MQEKYNLDERRTYQGTYGTLAGQRSLLYFMEGSGFFEEIHGEESRIAHNYVIRLLKTMGIFETEEDRMAMIRAAFESALRRSVQQSENKD